MLPLRSVTVLLFACVAWAAYWHLDPGHILFLDDQAFSIALGRLVLDGNFPLLGLPSHLGARHLGPLYLYFISAVEGAAQSDVYLTILLLTAAKVLGILVLLAIPPYIIDDRRPAELVRIGMLLSILTGYYTGLLRTDWINNIIFIPASFFFISALAVLRYGPNRLPQYLLASSILLQTHLSALPIILGVSLLILLPAFRSPAGGKALGAPLNVSLLLLTLILWLPPLIYEARYPSNIRSVILAHSAHQESPAGLFEALSATLKFFRAAGLGEASDIWRVLQITVAFACLYFIARYFRRPGRPGRAAAALILISIAAAAAALSRIPPPLHLYYLHPLLPLPPLLLGIAAAEALRSRTSFGVIFVLLLLVAAARSVINESVAPLSGPRAEFTTLEHAGEVAKLISADNGSVPTRILVSGSFPLRAGAYYALLPGHHFAAMRYAGRMKELQAEDGTKYQPDSGYLIRCSGKRDIALPGLPRNEQRKWEVSEALDLSTCRTCAHCALNRLKRTPDR